MSTMTNATPLVLPLQDVGRSDLAVAGGKGANLGELIHAGFSIPPGFLVTTVSYDHFVAHNHLDEIIVRALREEQVNGALIRDAFEGAPIPSEVERAVVAAYARARTGRCAFERDGRGFAGGGVRRPAGYLSKCRRPGSPAGRGASLLGSLWTDRAIAYRERLGDDKRTVRLAVGPAHGGGRGRGRALHRQSGYGRAR
jgi:rifampicin phosphotransferase